MLLSACLARRKWTLLREPGRRLDALEPVLVSQTPSFSKTNLLFDVALMRNQNFRDRKRARAIHFSLHPNFSLFARSLAGGIPGQICFTSTSPPALGFPP